MATNNPRPASARFSAAKRPAAGGSARQGAAKPEEETVKRSPTGRHTAQAKPAAPAKPAAQAKPVPQAKPAAKPPAPAEIDVDEHDATSTADLAKLAAAAEAAPTGDDQADAYAPAPTTGDEAEPSSTPSGARTAKAKPAAASSRKAPAASNTGRYAAKKGGGIGKWVVVGAVVVLAIAGLSYNPVRRSMALSALDACKDPAKAGEAIAAADAFLMVVGNSESHARVAIINNRGPVEAQIHLAKTLKLFSSLVQISERPLTDAPGDKSPPPRPDLPVITQDQRIAALNAATAIFNDSAHANDLLPDDLAKWAKDGMLKRELSIAAMHLIAKTRPKYANDVFSVVANEADQDPLRVSAALDGIGELSDVTNLGFAIGLLSGRVADLAITRTALTDKITRFSNADHLPRLIELLNSPKDAIRAIAIESMGGVNMRLGDTPDHVRRREELGKLITPKLDPATSPVELAAALKAVKALRLTGARDAVLALAPKIKGLMLDGIGEDFLAETLGKSLISPIPDAPPVGADGKKTDAQFAAETVRKAGEELIAKLIAGLDNDGTRTVCAKALSLVTDTKYLGLRTSLDKLAEHGTDDTCFTTLLFLVGKTYGRDDVTKSCGKTLDKWKAFLASDRPRFDRVKEIIDWMAKNGQFQYVKDGKARLTESKDFLAKAQEELDAWIQDKAFVAPLGLTKIGIEGLDKDVKMLGLNVRKAWAGAIE